jgi:hypothetical protein
MIRILSGWSNIGGSTIAFCNLTKALNEAGHETIFYGPHNWHITQLPQGQAGQYIKGSKLPVNKNDILLVHFMNSFNNRPPVKGFFFSSHEQDIFPIKSINYSIYDKIHYVSEHQKLYHMVDHPSFIIPNILNDLVPNVKPNKKIGGIIGSIDRNKRVDESIKKALNDNCELVLIYGVISDPWCWQKQVAPLVDGVKVIYKGIENDKQKMYDSVTDVYHSSILEIY